MPNGICLAASGKALALESPDYLESPVSQASFSPLHYRPQKPPANHQCE
jgi:hypothetical protein